MGSQVRSVGSHWPWLFAGVMSLSASTALVPRVPPAPDAPNSVATGRPPESHDDVAGGDRWLGGSEHALEMLADHLGVDAGFRQRARVERALATHLRAPQLSTLDLSKDAEGQKHRDALLRRFEADDYDRWLLGVVRERASVKHVRVQFVIAMMPDYVDSNSAWMFDSYLDAVQRAAGSARLVLDRFHLPDWAPEKGLEAGGGDRRVHEEEPGMILFRSTRPPEASDEDVDLLMVLVPTETATLGVHPAAFLSAAYLASNIAPGDPLLVLGPSFSGSTPSLVRALNEAKEHDLLPPYAGAPTVRILAGSATARVNQKRLQDTHLETLPQAVLAMHPECREVQFSSTSVSDQDYLVALRDYLGRIDEGWRFGQRMALLVEGNTGWGQGILDDRPSQALDNASERPLVAHDCRAGRRVFPCAQVLTFPLHISRLRGAAAARGRGPAGVDPLSSAVALELEEHVPPSDQIPAITPGITAATVETTLASLVDSVDRLHVNAVGIYATDKRDHLFLAQEITRRAPNVLLFALDSNLIYLHPEFRPYLRGTLVASPNPLFNLTQVLAGRPDARRLVQFPNTDAASVYNAFLALLGRPDKMLDYGAGCGPEARLANCAPSVWLGVVGEDDIWPLARVQPLPNVNRGYSWPGLAGALYPSHLATKDQQPKTQPSARAEWPHPMLFLLLGLVPALFVHALIAASLASTESAPDPARGWLRRLLPVLEPPHHRARRLRQGLRKAGRGKASRKDPRDAVLRQEYWLSILACGGGLWVVTTWLGGVAEAGRGVLDAGVWLPDALIAAVRWIGTDWRRDVLGAAIGVGAMACLLPTAARRRAGVGALTLLRVLPVAAGLLTMLELRSTFVEPGSLWTGELKGLNALRAASLGSFVSPTSMVLLLAAVAYAWGIWNLRRLHLQTAAFRPDSPMFELLTGGHPSVKEEFLEALNHPGLRTGSAFSWALVAFVALPLTLGWRLGHSIDGRSMGSFLLWGSLFAVFLMGHTLAHSLKLGRSLLGSLRSLNLHPIGLAFAQVAREPFLWRPSLRAPDGRMLAPLVRQAGAVLAALRRFQQQIPAETTQLVLRRSYGSVKVDRRFPPGQKKAPDAACRLVGFGLGVRAVDVHEVMDVELVDPEAFARDLSCHDPFQATATWARLEELAEPLVRALERSVWVHRPYPAETRDTPDWQREAETFLALQLAYGLRHVLVRLLSGLTIALLGFALILAAHLFYVFQGRAFWLTMDWVNLGLATALALLLLVRLEKDAVLSRLWSTQPGRLDWNGEFVRRMVVYGALPVVTLFATFFPEVGQSVFAWLEPVKKVLP